MSNVEEPGGPSPRIELGSQDLDELLHPTPSPDRSIALLADVKLRVDRTADPELWTLADHLIEHAYRVRDDPQASLHVAGELVTDPGRRCDLTALEEQRLDPELVAYRMHLLGLAARTALVAADVAPDAPRPAAGSHVGILRRARHALLAQLAPLPAIEDPDASSWCRTVREDATDALDRPDLELDEQHLTDCAGCRSIVTGLVSVASACGRFRQTIDPLHPVLFALTSSERERIGLTALPVRR